MINGRTVFSLTVLLVLLAGVFTARDWPIQARLLPWAIGIPAILLALTQLILDLVQDPGRQRGGQLMDLPVDESVPIVVVFRRALVFFGWFLGFIASIWLFGFFIAVPLFVFFYLLLDAGERWWIALLYVTGTMTFLLIVFDRILRLPWPEGAVQQWLGL